MLPMDNFFEIGKFNIEVASSGVNRFRAPVTNRVPSYNRERGPALIVQFTSRAKREEWISKYRQKKTLTAKDVNQRVYINDHLSPENKKLLSTLKRRCKEIGYVFAWCRNGKFFARKDTGEPVKKITCYEDIDKLK